MKYDDGKHIIDPIKRVAQLENENAKLKATVDALLAEKGEILELSERIQEKNRWWEDEYKSMETEFVRMRAQLDIVYLIFGGK